MQDHREVHHCGHSARAPIIQTASLPLLLPRLGFWPRALHRIAAIGLDLFKRGHGVLASGFRNFDAARLSNEGQFWMGLAAADVF